MTLDSARVLRMNVQATCAGCLRTHPLAHFRKWWGKRRILRTLCRVCEPEKPLEAMTPGERIHALDHQRPFATPTRIARLNDADIEAQKHRRAMGAKRRHSAERTRAWAPLLKALNQEKAWAFKNQITPHSPAWARFFEAYEASLKDAIQRVLKQKGQTTRIEPRPEEAHPTHWLFPETMRSLLRLYGQCVPPPGRKGYRDPAFLTWGETSPASALDNYQQPVSTKEK